MLNKVVMFVFMDVMNELYQVCNLHYKLMSNALKNTNNSENRANILLNLRMITEIINIIQNTARPISVSKDIETKHCLEMSREQFINLYKICMLTEKVAIINESKSVSKMDSEKWINHITLIREFFTLCDKDDVLSEIVTNIKQGLYNERTDGV